MADIFNDPITNATPIADTATDADRPVSELLMDKMRILIELLISGLYGVFETGSLTSDPPNDTTGWAIDTAAGFVDDEHNDRRIIFTTGNALGQDYYIDDTDAGNNRVVCTGDNLYAAGARSGDEYIIIGNFRNTNGHIHDGHNARNYVQYRSLIFSCANAGTTTSASFYTIMNTNIYIPENSQTITLKSYGQVTGGTGYYRFSISGSYSNQVTTSSTSSVNLPVMQYDASALGAGFYNMQIQAYGNGSDTVLMYAAAMFIE